MVVKKFKRLNSVKYSDEKIVTLKDVKDLYGILCQDNLIELFDLTDREVLILKLKWIEFKSFVQIGEHLNLSRERIRQLYCRSIARLKHSIGYSARLFKQQKEVVAENLKLKSDVEILIKRFEKLSLIEKETYSELYCKEFLVHLNETPIVKMALSNRVKYSLINADINTLADIKTKKRNDLLQLENFGKKSIAELENYLKEHFGLELKK
jgi:hypothetical protein